MGEQQNQPFQGGLLLVRELDERLGSSELIAEHLTNSRGKSTQLPMADLLRQAVYSRLAGYPRSDETFPPSDRRRAIYFWKQAEKAGALCE